MYVKQVHVHDIYGISGRWCDRAEHHKARRHLVCSKFLEKMPPWLECRELKPDVQCKALQTLLKFGPLS